jgi:hypothetical protein
MNVKDKLKATLSSARNTTKKVVGKVTGVAKNAYKKWDEAPTPKSGYPTAEQSERAQTRMRTEEELKKRIKKGM